MILCYNIKKFSVESICKSKYYDKCEIESHLVLFMFLGVCIFTWTTIMAILGRIYTIRLLALYGIHSIDDYATFLKLTEYEHDEDLAHEKKISTAELKQAVELVKSNINRKKMANPPSTILYSLYSYLYPPPSPSAEDESKQKEENHAEPNKPNKQRLSKTGSILLNRTRTTSKDVTFETRGSSLAHLSFTQFVSVAGYANKFKKALVKTRQTLSAVDTRIQDIAENMETHKYSHDLESVFLFKNPELFFGSIDLLLMAISFYLAFWLCNEISESFQYGINPDMWVILTLLPGLGSVIIFATIIQSAVVLNSISRLDADVVEGLIIFFIIIIFYLPLFNV